MTPMEAYAMKALKDSMGLHQVVRVERQRDDLDTGSEIFLLHGEGDGSCLSMMVTMHSVIFHKITSREVPR